MSEAKSEINMMRSVLIAIADLERNILHEYINASTSLITYLSSISSMYCELSQPFRDIVHRTINKNSLLNKSSDRKSNFDLIKSNNPESEFIAFPVHGGAVYEAIYENGKSITTTCISNTCKLPEGSFQTGVLPVPIFHRELDLRAGLSDRFYFEISLIVTEDSVKKNKQTIFELSRSGVEIKQYQNNSFDYEINKASWINWMSLVCFGANPFDELNSESKANIVAILGAYGIAPDPLFKTKLTAYANYNSDGTNVDESSLFAILNDDVIESLDNRCEGLTIVPSACVDVSPISVFSTRIDANNREDIVGGLFLSKPDKSHSLVCFY